MAEVYQSKYTAEEIESLLDKMNGIVSSGAVYSKTIFEGEILGVGSTGTMSESILNFDYLLIHVGSASGEENVLYSKSIDIIPVEDLTLGFTAIIKGGTINYDGEYILSRAGVGSNFNDICLSIRFIDEQTLEIIFDSAATHIIYKVVGIKNTKQYSTTEQIVGTFIDGKPIYQKTYEFDYLPTDGIDASELNIDTFINSHFIVKNNSSGAQYNGYGDFTTSSAIMHCIYYNTNLQTIYFQYYGLANNIAEKCYLTIQYTKQ